MATDVPAVLSKTSLGVDVDMLSEVMLGVGVDILSKTILGVSVDMLSEALVEIFSDKEIVVMSTPTIPLEFVVVVA